MKPSACLSGGSEEGGLPWAAEHTPSPEAGVRLHPVCGPSVPGGGLVTLLTRGKQAGVAEPAEVGRTTGPDSISRWGRGAPKEGHRADSWPHHTWPSCAAPEGPPRPAGARAGAGGARASALLPCPRLHRGWRARGLGKPMCVAAAAAVGHPERRPSQAWGLGNLRQLPFTAWKSETRSLPRAPGGGGGTRC